MARWKGTESALLFPSGYQANVAAIQTLCAVGESQKRGGCDLSSTSSRMPRSSTPCERSDAPWRVFPHNSMEKLHGLLEDAEADQIQVVVTESIFSMDGDEADLAALHRLQNDRYFLLVMDEAHASGVYGPNGAGLIAERGYRDLVDIFVVTFSKAIGCAGGAVCAKKNWEQARFEFRKGVHLFRRALPPATAAGIEEAIAVMRDEPQRQQRVRDFPESFAMRLRPKELRSRRAIRRSFRLFWGQSRRRWRYRGGCWRRDSWLRRCARRRCRAEQAGCA